MARERRLEAHQVEAIFLAFAEVMRELPPDTEAGWLDGEGDLRLAPRAQRARPPAPNARERRRWPIVVTNRRPGDSLILTVALPAEADRQTVRFSYD